MRAINILSAYVLPAAVSVLLSAVAHADDFALFARGGNASRAVQRGMDAPGTVVRYPEPHWTSRIGAGTAAAFAQGGNASKTVHAAHADGKTLRYPKAHWASGIGTGTAAAFER